MSNLYSIKVTDNLFQLLAETKGRFIHWS